MFTPTLRCECAQPGLIDTMRKWSIGWTRATHCLVVCLLLILSACKSFKSRCASYLPGQIALCEQSKSEKLGILCIFGQRNSLKFRKGSSFVRFAPSERKKKQLQDFCKNAHIQKIRKRSTFEILAPSSDKNPWYWLG